ncbi:MAG: hypothetical protein QOF01_2031, partial [Thermomicrobiales bacterium]|nr:hypothetical protein [Thermomicrobiales bacterium]
RPPGRHDTYPGCVFPAVGDDRVAVATYELWDTRTARPVGRWRSEAAALETVRAMLDRGEILMVAGLVLRSTDWGRAPVLVAAGADLAARARNPHAAWPPPEAEPSPRRSEEPRAGTERERDGEKA